jgi:ABC-type sugar transport system permease subunit
VEKNIRKIKVEPYLYIIPSVVIILFIYLFPVVKTVMNSFYRKGGAVDVYVGLQNYYYTFFRDSLFWISISNNLKLLLGVPILTLFGLLIASLLYQQIVGWKLFRIVLLIPYILSITVIGIVFDYILRLDGVLNSVIKAVHLELFALDWIGNPKIAMYSILGVVIWKELGFGIILFLARMLSVDTSVYDAAKVDGASWMRTFVNITIPELKNVIIFYIIINVINMLSWMFNYIFVMTRGGPVNSTYILEYYIFRYAIRFRQMGLASTIAVILFVIALIFVILQFIVRSKALREEGVY